MKKTVFFALFMLISTACHESLEERAAREAKEFTRKNCPMALSEYITNDSMVYEKDTRTIHYYYTMKGAADTTSIYTPKAREELIKGVKDAMQLKIYKENDFNFAYTYYSTKNKGQILIDVKVTPKDYKTDNKQNQ